MAELEVLVTVPLELDGYRCDDPMAHLTKIHDPNEGGGFTVGNNTETRWKRIEWRPAPACHACYPVYRVPKT